jgi:4-amino-4-deoxy-L-arabinose transferase-like glycosyltransferase
MPDSSRGSTPLEDSRAQALPEPPRSSASPGRGRHLWLPIALALLAALLRLGTVWVGIHRIPTKQLYGGFEVAFVGAAIASGHGFSCLYGVPSGPTAQFPPLYPLLVALAFRFFSAFSTQALWALCGFNILCESATVILLYWVGRRCFGNLMGFAAALLWAIAPWNTLYSIQVWYSSLSALLAIGIVACHVHLLDAPPRRRSWIGYGSLWALAALTNTSVILLIPFSLAALFYRWRRQMLRPALAALLIFFAALAPWTIRNYRVFHQFIPVRGNFGPTLWYGNRPDVKGPADSSRNPTHNPQELHDYLRLGERQYSALRGKMAMQFIRKNPGTFWRLTRDRILYFWTAELDSASGQGVKTACWSALAFAGLILMLRKRPLVAAVFAGALLLYPLMYYVTLAVIFYRYPIEPIITLLALYALFVLASAFSRFTLPRKVPAPNC